MLTQKEFNEIESAMESVRTSEGMIRVLSVIHILKKYLRNMPKPPPNTEAVHED